MTRSLKNLLNAFKTGLSLLVFISLALPLVAGAQDTPAYKNASLSADDRVADLLGRMTPEEKARQLDMYFGCESALQPGQYTNRTHALVGAIFDPQLAAEKIGAGGVGSIHDLYPRAALYNQVQAWIIASNRLGIPALFIEEGLHGYM